MENKYGAYMDKKLTVNPTNNGELRGMSFAVKDVFDIKGHNSSAGNPDWLQTHGPAKTTASSLQKLLNSGAVLKGTTITDELMYSLNGENFHYGTPVNPADEKRIPGGSSCGSAVTVAAGLTDFSIGTDTGGSVRIPSSYCGIFGMRPTHGLIAIDGVIPLAKSFDTVGWMAKNADILLKVGNVLINKKTVAAPFTQFVLAEDAWKLADEKVIPVLKRILETKVSINSSTILAEEGLEEWKEVFRVLQGKEIWQEHGDWIKKENPTFGPGIKERFEMASKITEEEVESATKKRKEIVRKMKELLKEDTILIIPTSPDVAPLLNLPTADLEEKRSQTLQLCCIAGLSGLPQVNVPVANIGGAPIGLSFIAGENQDIRLLQWVADMFGANK
ncbi:amidase [Niallia sp. NCCP-28]|uniref:amidase n=1 Tax=Niallia sp. NCCP-28 TaxID=2934712 RepID=UPI00207FEF51|nr:amidase [Niallia sp. NCCP-28]GKU84818.1 amidase [Niallia sp. NCCP-28]